jgi:hypothetical protein
MNMNIGHTVAVRDEHGFQSTVCPLPMQDNCGLGDVGMVERRVPVMNPSA